MADLILRCVRVFGFPDTKKLLEDAYKCLKEKEFSPIWFSEDECFSVTKKAKNTIYIFDVFEGEAFDHIAGLGCIILGPLSVLTSLTCKQEIPRRPVPVYNLAMKDVIVCCTNMDVETKNQIHLKIERMGGVTSKNFTEDVTHLVASKVGSRKYLVAASCGKQIMIPQWVDTVWEKSKLNAVHGLDEEFQEYKCPVFLGHTITVSGLSSKERKEAQRLIQKEGGTYSGEMKANECSHLIVNEPKGQKYSFAMKWKIFVVRSDWLYDSIEKGYCQDEMEYTVTSEKGAERGQMKTSTPERRSHAGSVSDINLSVIPMESVNETNMTTMTNMTNMTNMTVNSSHMMQDPDPTEGLDMQKLPLEQFLDGSKIYLSGFRGAVLEKLRKIINSGGGTRFNKISENLTHIVLGDRISGDIEQIKALHSRPFVVTCHWLVECYKQETRVEEASYTITEFSPKNPLTPDAKKGSRKSVAHREKSKPAASNQSVVEAQPGASKEEDEDELMSQYMAGPPQNQDETRSNNDTTVAPEEFEDDDCTQDPDNTTAVESAAGIFGGKTFVFYGFEEEHIPELSSFITENGGHVLKTNARKIPDYAIVPVDGFPVERTVKDIVTNMWLQMCIENKALLPIKSNRLFTPIEIKVEVEPLNDCVLSISGYAGTERDCLMHIAQVLGARIQEYFVRKANKGLLQSTHLIVFAPEGSKYQAAKKWNIPALSKHWLLDCAKSGCREPEDRYDIDSIDINNVEDKGPLDLTEETDKTCSTNQDTTRGSVHNQSAQGNHDKSTSDNQNQGPSDGDVTRDPADLDDGSAGDDKDKSVNGPEQDGATSESDKNSSKSSDTHANAAPVSNIDNRTSKAGDNMTGDFSQTGDTEALLAQMDTQGEVEVKDVTGERGLTGTVQGAKERGITSGGRIAEKKDLSTEVSVADGRSGVAQRVQVEKTKEKEMGDNHSSAGDSVGSLTKSATDKTYTKPGDKDWNWKWKTVVFGEQDERHSTETPPVKKFMRKLDQRPEQMSSPALTAMSAKEKLMAMTPVRHIVKPDSKTEVTMETNQSQKENVAAVVTPVQSRIREIKKQEGIADAKDTPSKFLNPSVAYNPKFNTEELMKAFETPEEKKAAKRRESLPLDELYDKALKQACRTVQMSVNKKKTTCSVLQGVVITVAKKLAKDQAELNETVVSLGGDYKWSCDSSCTHFIFQGRQNDTAKDFKMARSQGLLIVSPHWLYICKEQNARVDESLFPHTFNPNMQLSLSTKGTPMRTPRSTRRNARDRINSQQAETAQSPVVIMTKTTGNKEEEIDTNPRVPSPKPTGSGPKNPAEAMSDNDKAPASETPVEGEATGSLEMREVLSRQLENVMAEAKGKKRRRSKRLNNSGQVGTPEDVANSGSRRRTQENQRTTRNSADAERAGEKNSVEMAPSQSVHVVWDDPMGRMEQEKLAHKLQRVESPTQDPGAMYDEPEDAQYSEAEDDGEPPVPVFTDQPPIEDKTTPKLSRLGAGKTPTPEGPSIAFPTANNAKDVTPPKPIVIDNDEESQEQLKPPPVFMLSGLTSEEKVDYGALVEQLGGTMLETQEFDPRCTHLVISRITRNEKFLASIACGNWVLHKSYFEACREQNCFVDEELYEWGSEGTLSLVKNLDSNVRLLAVVARDWRVKLDAAKKNTDGRVGAFSSWRVLLCCDTSDLTGRERNYKRILEAGGATVFKDKPPFNMATEATHAMVEPQKAQLTQEDIEVLLAAGCYCLSPDFIAAYLKDPKVSPDQSCPPEIEAIRRKLQSSSSKAMKRKASGADMSLKRSKKR